ncbi:MAG: hypothetical protein KGZ82_10675 [Bacteroidales bacterium]|nr:hypothetical protein [Bacteroidales bacterium]
MKKFEGLSPLYKALKRGIYDLTGVEDVNWFHGYENIVLREQGIFIDFPDEILFEKITKSMKRAPVRIRLHVYTKVIRDVDGYVPHEQAEAHDTFALMVRDQLDNKGLFEAEGDFYAADFDNEDFFISNPQAQQLCRALSFTGWRYYHYFEGQMVTFVEFTTEVEA